MAVYHLNCGSMQPYWPRVQVIVYCLLVETDDGLLLVDTGLGMGDHLNPSRLMRVFTALMRSPRDPEETAIRQIARLGHDRGDVRHIVCTHLHLDHAGGLPDFPQARVHVHRPEYEAAMARRGIWGKFYRPEHWAHGPSWVPYDLGDETWFGFPCMPVEEGLSPRVLLVPLPGHTAGHCGVVVETEGGWLLHCGDAASPFYEGSDPYHSGDIDPNWLARTLSGTHAPRLRALVRAHGDEVRVISGHDSRSFARHRSPGSARS
jgi:glyoxylase-like metal-dependent hydrolase (beta-lactamase superfamily II)